ncbi:hypothetical protein Tco_1407925 [Tanacetum coccineum]
MKSQCMQNIINEVKNQLPKFLPKAVSDFATLLIQSIVKKSLEKTPLLLAQSSSQVQSSLKATELIFEYELKMILFDKMDKSRSYLTHDKHQALFDALFNSLSLDDAIELGEETSKGKALTKGSKAGKSATIEETVKEPINEPIMDDVVNISTEDVVRDDDQPHDASRPKTNKTPNWFTQPLRPLTPDPEWNKHQVYAMNQLKIYNLTQAHLVGPVYELLKGTCKSCIELEYNREECFKALTVKLDWNNLEGERCPFHLTNPLPLKGCLGRLTIATEYFFNNDLEFLKSSNPKKKYITSITKTKEARYEIVGIED